MGRPPCCDKVGVKKGPWTPDEDIMLVSYVQEHGPGNWKAVPTSTGLRRCSKSCRLRWANYLRPGIKRGSFTDEEEKMIIQLQALLGNKWAAISTYLPERTDNDIKNYWNSHLKKKLKKSGETDPSCDSSRQQAYASSTANIARLLKEWVKTTPPNASSSQEDTALIGLQGSNSHMFGLEDEVAAGLLEKWLLQDDQGRDYCWSNSCAFDD